MYKHFHAKIFGADLNLIGVLAGAAAARNFLPFGTETTLGVGLAAYMAVARASDLIVTLYHCTRTNTSADPHYPTRLKLLVAHNSCRLLNLGIGIGVTALLATSTSLPIFATIALGYASCRLLDCISRTVFAALETFYTKKKLDFKKIFIHCIRQAGMSLTCTAALFSASILPGVLAATPVLASSPVILCASSVVLAGAILFGLDVLTNRIIDAIEKSNSVSAI